MDCATIIEGGNALNRVRYWLPLFQLTGQALELALKACLASVSEAPPNVHDLVYLCQRVQAKGFELNAPMSAAIVHLNHLYFEDLATGTRYKTRYPTTTFEHVGGTVPDHATFVGILNMLRDQVAQRLPL